MKIKALIPVRSGSLRVKNKNIRPFAETSLLEIKIKQMLRISELNGVVVNSNDDGMLKLAKSLGAETVKRDEYFATSEVSPNELYENMAQNIDADIVLYTHCTTPLVKDITYSKALNAFHNKPDNKDSLITVSLLKEFLWVDGKPYNYDAKHKPRSQDLPENCVLLNHVIHILPRNLMIQKKDIIGYSPVMYPISKNESIDIDDQVDFDFAEFMYKRQIEEEK